MTAFFLHTCAIGVPDRDHPLATDEAHCNGCNPEAAGPRIPLAVALRLPGYPAAEHGFLGASGQLANTPQARAALEQLAIPRCREWREDHPEPPGQLTYTAPDGTVTDLTAEAAAVIGLAFLEPAPYCCSAYCTRCAGLRALDGEPPLQPNEWMNQ